MLNSYNLLNLAAPSVAERRVVVPVAIKREVFYGLTFFVGEYLYICKLTYIK